MTETDDRRRAPPGEFRVVGYDQYDYSDYVVGDFATPEEAGRVARARAASPNGTPTSFSDLFFVYDDQGTCLERVTYDELQEGGPPGAAGGLAVRSARRRAGGGAAGTLGGPSPGEGTTRPPGQ